MQYLQTASVNQHLSALNEYQCVSAEGLAINQFSRQTSSKELSTVTLGWQSGVKGDGLLFRMFGSLHWCQRENEKLSNCPTSIPGWGARGRAQRVKGGIEVFYPGLDMSCPPITCPRCCVSHHLCVDVVSYSACRALTNPSVIFPVVFHEECVESGIWPISGKAASSSPAANLNKIHTQTASIHIKHLTPRPTSYQNLKRSWWFFGLGGIGELGWKDENWKVWDHFMYLSFSLFFIQMKKNNHFIRRSPVHNSVLTRLHSTH